METSKNIINDPMRSYSKRKRHMGTGLSQFSPSTIVLCEGRSLNSIMRPEETSRRRSKARRIIEKRVSQIIHPLEQFSLLNGFRGYERTQYTKIMEQVGGTHSKDSALKKQAKRSQQFQTLLNPLLTKEINIGDVKYAVRLLLKTVLRNKPSNPKVMQKLALFIAFAKRSNIYGIEHRAQRVYEYFVNRKGIYDDVVITLRKLVKQISWANEKMRMMTIRQSVAQRHHKKVLSETNILPVTGRINIYDVILVPTIGGMHHSIVSEVNDDYVTCFPMTTASGNTLRLLGTKSVSLSGCGDPHYDGIRLTSSATHVPLKDAIQSHIGSVADNPHIRKKLAQIKILV